MIRPGRRWSDAHHELNQISRLPDRIPGNSTRAQRTRVLSELRLRLNGRRPYHFQVYWALGMKAYKLQVYPMTEEAVSIKSSSRM